MKRRLLLSATAVTAAALLGGCAAMHQVTVDVSTFGEWPGGRSPGSYAFERLPSQQANAEAQRALENAAAPALAKAGFRPAEAGAEPDVLVQVGARVTRADRSPWDDPMWWHGGFGTWRRSPWRGPAWHLGWHYEPARYDREAALLIRDRASGRPLYEARASNEGLYGADGGLLRALFAAAMLDFPRVGLNPRPVTVPLVP